MYRFLGRLRYGLLLASFGLLLSFSLAAFSQLSTAHASSQFDNAVKNTDKIVLSDQQGTDKTLDITASIKNLVVGDDTSKVAYTAMSASDQQSLKSAFGSGRYAITVSGSTPNIVNVTWDPNNSEVATPCGASPYNNCVTMYNGLGFETSTATKGVAIYYYSQDGNKVEITNSGRGPIGGYSQSQQYFSFQNTFPINYPTGYAGTKPGEQKIDKFPPIKYEVHGKDLYVDYTGENCIDNPNVPGQCAPFKLVYGVYSTDDTKQTNLNPKTLEYSDEYTYTVPSFGNYNLVIGYVSKGVPYTNLPDAYNYIGTAILLNFDGGDYVGQTDATCSTSDGIHSCVSNQLNCSQLDGFFNQIQCKVNRSFKTGIINPSIGALKQLFLSFIVPTNPTCSIPIGDVQLAPNKKFPLAQYSTIACQKAAMIRSAFPIAPIIVNFVLAFGLLALIVRLINRLTTPNETQIIEGI